MATQQVIAEHLDLDQSTVSRIVGELGLDWATVSLDVVRVAYIRRLREQAAGRVETGPLAHERRRLTAAKAARAEFELRELAGELVKRSDVERETFAVQRTLRDRVMGIPDRIAPIVAAEADAGRCHELLAAEVRLALTDVIERLREPAKEKV